MVTSKISDGNFSVFFTQRVQHVIKADRDIPAHETRRSTAEANAKPDTMESFRSYHSHLNTPKANKKKRRVSC